MIHCRFGIFLVLFAFKCSLVTFFTIFRLYEDSKWLKNCRKMAEKFVTLINVILRKIIEESQYNVITVVLLIPMTDGMPSYNDCVCVRKRFSWRSYQTSFDCEVMCISKAKSSTLFCFASSRQIAHLGKVIHAVNNFQFLWIFIDEKII